MMSDVYVMGLGRKRKARADCTWDRRLTENNRDMSCKEDEVEEVELPRGNRARCHSSTETVTLSRQNVNLENVKKRSWCSLD